MGREDDLFRKLTTGHAVLTEGPAVGSDVIYTPPTGAIRSDRRLNQPLQDFVPKEPTKQTDLLQNIERRYILPFVPVLCPIFKVPPVTDDIYRYLAEEVKDAGLFLVISRSYVKRLSSGQLLWDAVLVVIKKKIAARIRCLYDPRPATLVIKEVHLWQNNAGDYYRIADVPLDWTIVPGIMDKYVEYEGIFRDNSEGQ